MDEAARHTLRHLLTQQRVAALATLHRGDPQVSMVPFALDTHPANAPTLLIHVSALAPHTRDMQDHPRVSLLVMDRLDDPDAAQALARVSLQGTAEFLPRDTPQDRQARAVYLARFASAALTFGLADFSMVRITPQSVRLVAGFGRAFGFTRETWAHAVTGHLAPPPAN